VLETQFHRLGKKFSTIGCMGGINSASQKLAVRLFLVTWRTVRQELSDVG
jgi:hypothetical protein